MYKKICTYSNSFDKNNECILDIINSFFKKENINNVYNIPAGLGEGYFSAITPNKDILITLMDIKFNNRVSFLEVTKTKCFLLYFCISESFIWQDAYSHKNFMLDTDELFLHRDYDFRSNNIMEANKKYIGIGIALDKEKYKDIIEEYFYDDIISNLFNQELNKIGISFKTKKVLKDILECEYSRDLKNIYIEGKVLELLAILAHELKEGKASMRKKYISRSDLEGLNNVKSVIDANYVEPLTIDELSKIALVSQTKLKTSFKNIYGKTIYEYVIQKRMETAKELLDERKIKVKEAAVLVGYSNIGYFSRVFKERYGFTPSEYMRCK